MSLAAAGSGNAVDDNCRQRLALLEQLPALYTIIVADGRFGPCNAELFASLAARPGLATLGFGGDTGVVLNNAISQAKPLQRLHIHIHIAALPPAAARACCAALHRADLTFRSSY
jgi:hypothetical protein